MNKTFLGLLVAIAMLSTSACQSQTSSPNTAADAPADTTADTATESTPADDMATAPADLPAGISLSDDGQTVIMTSGSTLEAYCSEGNGMLAISAVGEAGGTGQALGCGQTFDGFDAARNNGFADVTFVAPMIMENALQLQDTEYTKVECQADHAGLAPVLPEKSDGHMSLECI